MKFRFAFLTVAATFLFLTMPSLSMAQSQVIRCESDGYTRKYCPVDTRGGVRLSRQRGGVACTQGSTWGYDDRGIWVDGGCSADFEVLTAAYGSGASAPQSLRCESDSNSYDRKYCAADTRGGVRLTRQISGASCTQGSTWGYDDRGVWVSNGCRADFEVAQSGYGSGYGAGAGSGTGYGQGPYSDTSQTVRCESTTATTTRTYCAADTRGGVQLTRQLGRTACTQDSTWGYNRRGVWVTGGCRGIFQVNPNSDASTYGAPQIIRCESVQANSYGRKYCPADTRGGVRFSRQIGSSQCTQGSTWGYDNGGVWVDNGCRAEFELAGNGRYNGPPVGSSTFTVIPNGSEISVRTNDAIDSHTAVAGQRFSGVVAADVLDSSGRVAIPKGSDARLAIRSASGGATSDSELVLDVDSVTVGGIRYNISTSDLQQQGDQGVGANRRTAEMVGGGAVLGTIIGAIAGGGKGAAIGAAVGAAAGAGTEILTKGKEVRVPSETVLNFRLDQDLTLRPVR